MPSASIVSCFWWNSKTLRFTLDFVPYFAYESVHNQNQIEYMIFKENIADIYCNVHHHYGLID